MKKLITIILFILFSSVLYCQNTYQYDNINRLQKVTFPNGTVYDYSYDQLGNRSVKVVTATAPMLPDLLIQNQSVGQTSFAAGTTITATCRLTNSGTGAAGGNYTKVFLSANQTYELGTDMEIGSVYNTSVSAGGNVQLNTNITIPAGTTTGSWYILFFADATTQVGETNENNNIATIAVTVVTCLNMQASSSSTNASCGLANGTATVNVNGGNQPYAYQWSSGQSTAFITGISGGSYMVTITDFYGCSQTASCTVNSILPPSLNMSSTPSTCGNSNGTASATVTGGTAPFGFIWSNGQTTATLTSISGGNYTVTVTDATSCAANGNVTVNSPGNLNASVIMTNPTCGANNGALSATVSGGTPPYSYNWSNNQQTQTITGLLAGSYSVTITDAGNCSFTTSTALSSTNNISVSFVTQNTTCGNANGTATATGSNGTAPYIYHWSNAQNSATATNLAQGAYTVTVTDAHNCSTISYASIGATLPPVIIITTSPSSCSGNTGTATATIANGTSPFSYLWSNGQTAQTATGLSAGAYSLTVNDNSGCSANSTANIVYQNATMGIPTNGLVAYYPFNGNANDSSGNSNNGTINGATLTTDRFNRPNSALNFAGISNPQTVFIPNSSSLQFSTAATFSLWIKMNSYQGMNGYGQNVTNGYHVLFAKNFDNCCLSTGINGLQNGMFSAHIGTGPGGNGFGDTVPNSSVGQWTNITYVITTTNISIYANGSLIASQNGTMSFTTSNSKDLWFGRLASTWYPFNGKMDDIAIYSRALSNSEILQLYQGNSGNSNISVHLGNDTTICSNQAFTLDAGAGFNSYQWSTTDNTQSIVLSNMNPGNHQYSVKVSACGSTATDTIQIHVAPLPEVAGTITGATAVCQSSSLIAYSVPAIANANSYVWTLPNGATGTSSSNSINVNYGTSATSGNISVKGYNSCGLGAASALTVVVNPLPSNAGIVSGPASVCQGQNTVLYKVPVISNSTSYFWQLSGGATGASNTDSILVDFGLSSYSGNISVKGMNACGSGNSSVLGVVVNAKPETPVITQIGNILHSDAIIGNQWYDGNGIINGATQQDYTASTNGFYYTIVDVVGCASDSSNTISIDLSGIADIHIPESALIATAIPNPFMNELTFVLRSEKNVTINVYIVNENGQKVKEVASEMPLNSGSEERIVADMTDFAAGLYLGVIECGKQIRVLKMIKNSRSARGKAKTAGSNDYDEKFEKIRLEIEKAFQKK